MSRKNPEEEAKEAREAKRAAVTALAFGFIALLLWLLPPVFFALAMSCWNC